jgi:UDPglucose 6-dehydrogenase
MVQMLHKLGTKVKAYDPIICGEGRDNLLTMYPVLENAMLVKNPEILAKGSDAIVLMTEWQEFQTINYCNLAELMRIPLMIDCRNFLPAPEIIKAGFKYVGIGIQHT